MNIALVLLGLGLLIWGGDLLVKGAGRIALLVRVSPAEIFTSGVASWRGHDDVAVANVVGSNIFNVLGILGATAFVTPIQVDEKFLSSDIWWMLGASLALLPLMWPGMRIQRWKGVLLLVMAAIYVASL